MDYDLTGKTALVTGASSGFGRHFSKVLAKRGAEVVLMARRAEAIEALANEIRVEGGLAMPVAIDVCHAENVADRIAGLSRLDVLVNNAGVAGKSNALDCSEEEWRWTFDVNVQAAWFVARASALKMIEGARGGSIINIASITGIRPGAGSTAYSVSKAAVIQMTKALAGEWARHSIRVNALAPGYFETDLNREFLNTDAGRALIKRIPQRRLGRMPDLDGPLLLLASNGSAYMTGSTIEVDGGHLVQHL